MPVFGYLAIPVTGAIDALCTELKSLPFCEIIPAENREMLVLVTDTPDDETEKELQNTLKSLRSLHSLSMTFGYNDEQQLDKKAR